MSVYDEPYVPAALRTGLIAGAAAVLFSLVGMVEAFGARGVISGVLTLGHTFLVAAMLLAGYMAARRAQAAGARATLISGALAGLVTGALLAVLVIVGSLIDLRQVLINASAGLYNLLTFGQSTYVGAVVLVVLGLVLGAAAGGIVLLAPDVRRLVMQAALWVVLIGVLSELLRLIMAPWGILPYIGWMFGRQGLSIVGALLVAAVIGLVGWARARGWLGTPQPAAGARWTGRQGFARMAIIIGALAVMPLVMGAYISEVLDQVGLMLLMGLGLNIVVGFAGLLDLGYVAFYAIGAYVMGVLTSPELGFFSLSWWAAMPIAVLVAIFAGILLGIPVLRMRGDYLAIVTLGFGEIIRLLALSNWLQPYVGGPQGIQLIAKPVIGDFVFDNQVKLYYLILAGCLLAAFVSTRLRDSRLGRAWMAMREDEDVAQAIGVNLVTTKLLAFATGAAFSGLSGAIFAAKLGAIYPHSFGLLISINVLALIIIGGMGSIPGVVVGALALVGLPELLREFNEFRLLVYGAVLVVMMLYRPEGLWPEAMHKRELHADEAEPAVDAIAQPAEPGEATIEMGRPVT